VSPGRLDLYCVALRNLVSVAYGTFSGENVNTRRLEVVGGPHWIDTDKFDISAKAEGGATGPQMMGPMLQALLEDRFQVKVHVGSQDGPVYAMTVAKNGPKLQPTKEGSCVPIDLNNTPRTPSKRGEQPKPCGFGGGLTHDGVNFVADWYGTTMAQLAGRFLQSYVGRPVIDRTGLAGQFDIHLEYVREDAPRGPTLLDGQPIPDLPAPTADSTGPSIFTALESQLGLKLSPTRGPVDVIIVDQAEKPSAN
jgi:uncharacterized protein (TIGR03435 family)